MDWTALATTFRLAAVVTPLLLVFSLPVAWYLACTPWRGRRVVEAAVNLPIVVPPSVLGLGLLLALGPASPLGAAWRDVFGAPLTFSFAGLVAGSMVYSLPFAVIPLRTAFEKVDPGIVEAARAQGMTGAQVFAYMILPNARGGIVAAAALVFAHTVGEFGVALMIGGSIPGETRVASIAIFEHAEMLDFRAAGLLSLVLVVVSYGVLFFLGGLNGGLGPGRRTSRAASCATPAPRRVRRRVRRHGNASAARGDLTPQRR